MCTLLPTSVATWDPAKVTTGGKGTQEEICLISTIVLFVAKPPEALRGASPRGRWVQHTPPSSLAASSAWKPGSAWASDVLRSFLGGVSTSAGEAAESALEGALEGEGKRMAQGSLNWKAAPRKEEEGHTCLWGRQGKLPPASAGCTEGGPLGHSSSEGPPGPSGPTRAPHGEFTAPK